MSELLKDMSLILVASMLLSLGFMAFNQPPLLGYILAGTIVGPSFTQVIQDPSILHTMGEFGLILLLFLVGLEINLEDFKKIWLKTLIFVTVQILGSGLLAAMGMFFLGWGAAFSILVSFITTLSSTAVVITLLENLGILQSKTGSFAVSVLIAQDLALMPMILIVRSLNPESSDSGNMLTLFLALVVLVFAVLYFGKQPTETKTKLYYKNLLKRPEVTTLIGGSVCFTFAALADWFQLSGAYGAFIAGLMLGNRWDRELLVRAFIPITSMMMMVFFISVGVRVSFSFIAQNIGWIMISLLIVMTAKMLINIAGLTVVRWSLRSTIFVAGLLAQMSEFSFVLISEGLRNNVINEYGSNFLVALTVLSLAFGSVLPLMTQNKK